ncbi:hypothetical protein DB347_03280 [Opitutaceae bacterium EW11]|nr:hypothetical protein DB347_03280 [Opitutaceae bacterium EW11]
MKRPTFFRAFAALALIAAAWGGCAKPAQEQSAPKPSVVRVSPVEYTSEAVPIRVAGILSRRAEAELSFKVGGVIQEIAVRAGDPVKKGDILARLRPDEIEAQVVQARSALEKARRDLDRVRRLQENNVATLENAQDAATAVEVAAAGLRVAEFNRDHAVIVAPADGHVLRRTAEPDELAAPGRAILTFGSEDEGWLVRAGLSERDASRIRVGDRALVEDEELGSGAKAEASVRHIAEAADPSTRTTEVELALEAPLPSARSGYVMAVVIHPGEVPARPVVPASALIEGTDRKASVFVVDQGAAKARRIAVEIGEIDRERVFLRGDLPRGASVVTAGAEYLVDGSPVEVVRD